MPSFYYNSQLKVLTLVFFLKSTYPKNLLKSTKGKASFIKLFIYFTLTKCCLLHSSNLTTTLYITTFPFFDCCPSKPFRALKNPHSRSIALYFPSKALVFLFMRNSLQNFVLQQNRTISNEINLSSSNLMSNQLQTLLCSTYFAACGFQSAQKTNIPSVLKRINPDGGTAMRDSLIQGCKLMLKLNQVLKEVQSDSHWNFVHVILTDGADCNSKNSLQDAAKMMVLIGKLIEVKTLKIIIIGVGVEDKAEKELRFLAAVGGENAEYYNVNSSDISNIFNKIEIGLGLQQNLKMMGVTSSEGNAVFLKREVNPYLQIKIKNFAVMFNLDVSGSMSGNKWNNVCSSVSTFISKMGGSDLVSGLVFNDQVRMLSNIKEDDKLLNRPRAVSNTSKTTNSTSATTQKTFYVQSVQGNPKNPEECTIM